LLFWVENLHVHYNLINMKTKLVLTISGVLLCFYACKKVVNINPASIIGKSNIVVDSTSAGADSAIIGKWNIVVDSTSAGAGSAISFASYHGKPGDYFYIRNNSYIYIKEGATLDTLKYNLLSDSTITIQSFIYTLNGVVYQTCHIKNLSQNTMSIYLPWILTPGGPLGRKIILSR
jgi:hypothetical protein